MQRPEGWVNTGEDPSDTDDDDSFSGPELEPASVETFRYAIKLLRENGFTNTADR